MYSVRHCWYYNQFPYSLVSCKAIQLILSAVFFWYNLLLVQRCVDLLLSCFESWYHKYNTILYVGLRVPDEPMCFIVYQLCCLSIHLLRFSAKSYLISVYMYKSFHLLLSSDVIYHSSKACRSNFWAAQPVISVKTWFVSLHLTLNY